MRSRNLFHLAGGGLSVSQPNLPPQMSHKPEPGYKQTSLPVQQALSKLSKVSYIYCNLILVAASMLCNVHTSRSVIIIA